MILIKIVRKKVLSLVLKTNFTLQLFISYGSLFQQRGYIDKNSTVVSDFFQNQMELVTNMDLWLF